MIRDRKVVNHVSYQIFRPRVLDIQEFQWKVINKNDWMMCVAAAFKQLSVVVVAIVVHGYALLFDIFQQELWLKTFFICLKSKWRKWSQ